MPKLPQHDPLAVPANYQEITQLRNALEAAPVLVEGVLVDIDERSEKRMQKAIDYWNDLGVQSIDWILADDTTLTVTRQELIVLLASARRARALRGMQLHQAARTFKADPTTTRRDLANWTQSVLEG